MSVPLTHIDHVIGSVYISGANDAYPQAELLQQAGIRHILKLYNNDPHWPTPFTVCDHTIRDRAAVSLDQLQRGVAFIDDCQQQNQPVLVACRYGISRSSTFVLAYLVSICGYDLADAWHLLLQHHPRAYPAYELWQSLITHYHLPYTMMDIARWLGNPAYAG
jgi:protein-tyrosine phosphatase